MGDNVRDKKQHAPSPALDSIHLNDLVSSIIYTKQEHSRSAKRIMQEQSYDSHKMYMVAGVQAFSNDLDLLVGIAFDPAKTVRTPKHYDISGPDHLTLSITVDTQEQVHNIRSCLRGISEETSGYKSLMQSKFGSHELFSRYLLTDGTITLYGLEPHHVEQVRDILDVVGKDKVKHIQLYARDEWYEGVPSFVLDIGKIGISINWKGHMRQEYSTIFKSKYEHEKLPVQEKPIEEKEVSHFHMFHIKDYLPKKIYRPETINHYNARKVQHKG